MKRARRNSRRCAQRTLMTILWVVTVGLLTCVFVAPLNAQQAALTRDIVPMTQGSEPHSLTNVDGTVFFSADSDPFDDFPQIWKSDGTESGTQWVEYVLISSSVDHQSDLTAVDGMLYFIHHWVDPASEWFGMELYRTDGSEIVYLKGWTTPHYPPGPEYFARGLTAGDGVLYFFITTDSGNPALWRSDGTSDGTIEVAPVGSLDYQFDIPVAYVNGTLFFLVGETLWKSDGTNVGTEVVKTFVYDPYSDPPLELIGADGGVFMTAKDDDHGVELWRSEGTEAGTVMVKDINPGAPGADPIQLTALNGTVFFSARDGAHGRELWKSDGTVAGTVLVRDIHPSGWSSPIRLTAVGDRLFFTADDGVHDREPWRSDGTEAGTLLVRDINPAGSSSAGGLTDVNGSLLFAAFEETHGRELWRSDGTEAGTRLVHDLFPGSESSNPKDLVDADGTLFFVAEEDVHGEEVWILLAEFQDLKCIPQGDDVALTWALGGTASAIEVRRNGEPIALLPGTTTTYVDADPPGDTIDYELVALNAAVETVSGVCTVTLACNPVTDVVCTASGDHEVALTWALGDSSYLVIALFREGEMIALLGGEETGFTDVDVLPGVYTYAVQGGCGEGNWSPQVSCEVTQAGPAFLRADADGNGVFNGLLDGLYTLAYQFQDGPAPPCLEAADADGDGTFNGLVDGLYLLGHQFSGGPAPPAPYPVCGDDPDPASSLGCEAHPGCS